MANITDAVSVQNLLASFCCVLEKDILRHFSLLGALCKRLYFWSYLYIKLKTTKNFNGTAIFSIFGRRLGYLFDSGFSMYSTFNPFLRVRRIKIIQKEPNLVVRRASFYDIGFLSLAGEKTILRIKVKLIFLLCFFYQCNCFKVLNVSIFDLRFDLIQLYTKLICSCMPLLTSCAQLLLPKIACSLLVSDKSFFNLGKNTRISLKSIEQ